MMVQLPKMAIMPSHIREKMAFDMTNEGWPITPQHVFRFRLLFQTNIS